MFISAVKLATLICLSLGIDSLLQPTPYGHLKNFLYWHLHWLHFSATEVATCYSLRDASTSLAGLPSASKTGNGTSI